MCYALSPSDIVCNALSHVSHMRACYKNDTLVAKCKAGVVPPTVCDPKSKDR